MVQGVLCWLLAICSSQIAQPAFKKNSFDDRPQPHTTIGVAVALEAEGFQRGFAGRIGVRVWTKIGDFAGVRLDEHIPQGTARTFDVVHQDMVGPRQTPYAVFSVNDESICIAWVTATWSDGNSWVWLGDWANDQACDNAAWSYSNMYIEQPGAGSHSPTCIWLDKKGDAGRTGSFQVFWPAFAESRKVSKPGDQGPTLEEICDTPNYSVFSQGDNAQVAYWTSEPSDIYQPGDGPNSGQGSQGENLPNATLSRTLENVATGSASPSQSTRRPRGRYAKTSAPLLSSDSRIIFSSKAIHSAARLCRSHSSWGPSLVSFAERSYCDMRTKTLYPFCETDGEGEACYNAENKTIHEIVSVPERGLDQLGRRARAVEFSKILDWDLE